MINNAFNSGRRRARPGTAGLAALMAAAQSPDPLAFDIFVRGPGRPLRSTPSRKKRGRPKEKRPYERRPYHKVVVGLGEAYCVKCRGAKPIAQPVLTKFSNDRTVIAGACTSCGKGVWKAIGKAALSGL